MADRFLSSEVQQIGIESAPGTAAVPTIQFQSLSYEIDTAAEFDEFGPSGQITNTIVAERQEWAAGSLTGFPSYTEIAYPISNALGAATITTPSGATDARRWLWEPSASTPWVPKTQTLRRGVSGDTAEEANYLLQTGLGFSFSRTDTPEISGDIFAQRLNYAVSLATTGVGFHTEMPILPSQGDVYIDSASGSLGTTKMLRDFTFEWSISDLFGMIWPINSALPSFAAHSRKKPTIEAVLQLGNDAAGRAFVTNMRAGTTVFVRFIATGPEIESGFDYSLTIDAALKVVDAPSRGDVEELSTLEWTFRNVSDATWGKWVSIELITDFAALGTP